MGDICVIGAGITGLVIANELQRAGHSVTLLEKGRRPGGVIESRSLNGYLLEYGANSTLASPELVALIDRLGLTSRILTPAPSAKKRFIVGKTNAHSLTLRLAPRRIWDFPFTPILSPVEKLRFIADIFTRPSSNEDESSKQFFSRHFGSGFTEKFVAAIANGIWAGDITTLSARTAFPEIWGIDQQYGSLLLGGVLRGIKRWKKPRPAFQGTISFQNGLRELVDALSGELAAGTFKPECEVIEITNGEKHAAVSYSKNETVHRVEFERVILTANGEKLSHILPSSDGELAASALRIPFSPIGLLHLGISSKNVEHPLDGFGFLVPPFLKTTLLGCVFNSSLFPNRAPDGRHLLTCFVGGALHPAEADVRDTKLQQKVFAELDQLLGLRETPQVIDATFLPAAIPNYPLRHFEFEEKLESFHRQNPRIRIASSSGRGIGVPARVREGLAAARQISLDFDQTALTENAQHALRNRK